MKAKKYRLYKGFLTDYEFPVFFFYRNLIPAYTMSKQLKTKYIGFQSIDVDFPANEKYVLEKLYIC